MGQSVEQRPGQALGTERLGPLVEGEIRGDQKEPADHGPSPKDREPAAPIRERGAGMDLGL